MSSTGRAVLRFRSLITPLTAAVVTLALLAALLTGAPPFSASADHDPGTTTTVDIYGFDMVPGANAATSVDVIQSCTTLASVGNTTTIDIIVDQVPAFTGSAAGLGGYSGTVNFNQAVIKINSYTALMLFAAAPPGIPITFGTDPTPDTDGAWAFSQGELAGGIEDGEGVALRLTVEAVGAGTSTLTLTSPSVKDANGVDYTLNNTPSGQIVVGGACPTLIPTATPTPTATATPSLTPTASPTPTPAGQTPTPTPSPTPTPTPTPMATPVGQTPSPTPFPTATPTPAQEVVWGDANCSGSTDPVDSLLTLRFDAGLSTNTGDCPDFGQVVDVQNASPHPWGDVDCGGDVTPVDSLKLLRYDAGLSVSQEEGCPAMGSEVLVLD